MNDSELRDHFAGLAMQALISTAISGVNDMSKARVEALAGYIAARAYIQADAMMLD